MKGVHALSAIVLLSMSLASFIPLQATRLEPAQTMTITTIVRVPTTIVLNVTFTFETQGTYRIPILAVNATLIAYGNGLQGIIAGQPLDVATSWDRAVSCVTNSQGICLLTFSIPPLGGANTLTATYAGNTYFASCAVTRIL